MRIRTNNAYLKYRNPGPVKKILYNIGEHLSIIILKFNNNFIYGLFTWNKKKIERKKSTVYLLYKVIII